MWTGCTCQIRARTQTQSSWKLYLPWPKLGWKVGSQPTLHFIIRLLHLSIPGLYSTDRASPNFPPASPPLPFVTPHAERTKLIVELTLHMLTCSSPRLFPLLLVRSTRSIVNVRLKPAFHLHQQSVLFPPHGKIHGNMRIFGPSIVQSALPRLDPTSELAGWKQN